MTQPLREQDEWLSVDEFALLARYTPNTVYQKIAKGEIPGVVRFGKSIRILKSLAFRFERSRSSPYSLRRS